MWFLHYLHHVFFDPISKAEELQFALFVGIPVSLVILIGYALFQAWWQRYTGESDE